MNEIECTATVGEGEPTPHLLYTPPCPCPNCAPEPATSARADRNWLRIPGLQQRKRVELVDLGAAGHDMLG